MLVTKKGSSPQGAMKVKINNLINLYTRGISLLLPIVLYLRDVTTSSKVCCYN